MSWAKQKINLNQANSNLSKLVVTEGTKADAEKFQQQYGGKVYVSRADACFTVSGGSKKAVFWNVTSQAEKVRQQTYELAEQLGISLALHPDLTPGKLGELFWMETIGIDPVRDRKQKKRSGYYGNSWLALAKRQDTECRKKLPYLISVEEDHWHFTHHLPHQPQWLVDRDIKSAFLSAFSHAPTLFLHEAPNGTSVFIDDEGAMQRLRALIPYLPKWFKHRLVGQLASHQYERIRWGAAFNTAQWAILRVYRFMARVKEIAGENGVRYFVDCVTLKGSTPAAIVEAIDQEAEKWGFEFGTKALGYGQLWSPVEGFIGWGNPIGEELDVAAKMQEQGLKYRPQAFTHEMVQNFSTRLCTHLLQWKDRSVFGHWNKVAFWSVGQPITGSVAEKSEWYMAYPDDPEFGERERKRSQIKPLVMKI